jgi:hypothetical protein
MLMGSLRDDSHRNPTQEKAVTMATDYPEQARSRQ